MIDDYLKKIIKKHELRFWVEVRKKPEGKKFEYHSIHGFADEQSARGYSVKLHQKNPDGFVISIHDSKENRGLIWKIDRYSNGPWEPRTPDGVLVEPLEDL